VLSPQLAAGISAERFERELRLAASLQQANIVPLLRQAVTIDTGFAMAWRKLGDAYNGAGASQSLAFEAITKAFRLRSRLSDSERYMVEASYYVPNGPGSDRPKAAGS
jgi:hypothetical protein